MYVPVYQSEKVGTTPIRLAGVKEALRLAWQGRSGEFTGKPARMERAAIQATTGHPDSLPIRDEAHYTLDRGRTQLLPNAIDGLIQRRLPLSAIVLERPVAALRRMP
jgi:hypothetical protein